ncbi:MAG: hypothetical protein EB127_10225 [Alphaproteobacteria bacterium]|nr:hypothetical protein [Alphaproteobacteria bacterium]
MNDPGIKILSIDESGNINSRPMSSSEFDELGEAIRKNVDASVDAPYDNSGDNWSGYIYGHCPVQGEGKLNFKDKELSWYFRARHDKWSFEVEESNIESPHYIFYQGEYENSSWMKYSHAWKIITTCLEKYQKENQ